MKKKLILSSLAAIILGITGCQSNNTIKITENNQTIVIPKSPQKIVVMNYGALDTLDALGKGTLVVGTSLPAIPQYLQQYKTGNVVDTGRMKEPNFDVIKQIAPDLIIIDRRQADQTDELSKIAPVVNLDVDATNYLESTKNHILLLGKITGTDSLAANYTASLDSKITHAQKLAQNSHKKALVAIHNDGKVFLTNTGARPTLIHDVLQVKRAVPVTEQVINPTEKQLPTLIDNHYIATNKPDIIYLVDRSKAIGNKAIEKDFFNKNTLTKSGTKIVYLTADIWYLSGGGVESLNRQIDEVVSGLK